MDTLKGLTGEVGEMIIKIEWCSLQTLKLRFLLLVCLLLLLMCATACGSLTNFVVINSSDQVLHVSYKVKEPPDALKDSIRMLPIAPAVKPVAEVEEQVAWRDLSENEVQFDPRNRTAVILLQPGQALRIEHRNLQDGPKDEAGKARNFGIEEIALSGSSGVVAYDGDEVRKAFVMRSQSTAVLDYK